VRISRLARLELCFAQLDNIFQPLDHPAPQDDPGIISKKPSHVAV